MKITRVCIYNVKTLESNKPTRTFTLLKKESMSKELALKRGVRVVVDFIPNSKSNLIEQAKNVVDRNKDAIVEVTPMPDFSIHIGMDKNEYVKGCCLLVREGIKLSQLKGNCLMEDGISVYRISSNSPVETLVSAVSTRISKIKTEGELIDYSDPRRRSELMRKKTSDLAPAYHVGLGSEYSSVGVYQTSVETSMGSESQNWLIVRNANLVLNMAMSEKIYKSDNLPQLCQSLPYLDFKTESENTRHIIAHKILAGIPEITLSQQNMTKYDVGKKTFDGLVPAMNWNFNSLQNKTINGTQYCQFYNACLNISNSREVLLGLGIENGYMRYSVELQGDSNPFRVFPLGVPMRPRRSGEEAEKYLERYEPSKQQSIMFGGPFAHHYKIAYVDYDTNFLKGNEWQKMLIKLVGFNPQKNRVYPRLIHIGEYDESKLKMKDIMILSRKKKGEQQDLVPILYTHEESSRIWAMWPSYKEKRGGAVLLASSFKEDEVRFYVDRDFLEFALNQKKN